MSRNYGCRITKDMVINGLKAVVMENEKLRLTILVDKGTDIYELLYKPKDVDFMWRSPNALTDPAVFGQYTQDSLCNYLDLYCGGWQEILPNGGPSCYYKGAQLGMHGEVVNVPWSYEVLEDSPEYISVKFTVRTRRTPFVLEKTISLESDESVLYFDEVLENEGEESMDLMWGQHPTLGEPFLDESCVIETSARSFIIDGPEKDFESQRLDAGQKFNWPFGQASDGSKVDLSLVPAKESKTADMVYLTDFEGDAYYEVINKRRKLSFGMRWDKELFPYVWMWQVCKGAEGYPWYGRTYNMALEPWTSYPGKGLLEAINNGSSFELAAKTKVGTSFECYIAEKG